MTKAGKWLDKSLSKLIGVGELPEGVQPLEGKPPQQPHHRPRSFSQPASPRVSPAACLLFQAGGLSGTPSGLCCEGGVGLGVGVLIRASSSDDGRST